MKESLRVPSTVRLGIAEEESVRDDVSTATAALDVDVEEVGDRLDLLRETVEGLENNNQALELLKIVSPISF